MTTHTYDTTKPALARMQELPDPEKPIPIPPDPLPEPPPTEPLPPDPVPPPDPSPPSPVPPAPIPLPVPPIIISRPPSPPSIYGYAGVKRWLLGSVAQSVVSHAPCSVEAVRRKEDSA